MRAAREVVRRVRRRIPAELVRVLLFGSKSRGEARPDSDVDLLLIFRDLPPDREPHATHAEQIAEAVAEQSGVPVATWSVSLIDLERGQRTPMLVDALDDGIVLWPGAAGPLRVDFTPDDALHCTRALLARVDEGSDEVRQCLSQRDVAGALRRGRDDIVRLSTAALLLRGETRPRRGEAVRRFAAVYGRHNQQVRMIAPTLRWAATSFGPNGNDDAFPVGSPAGGIGAVSAAVGVLRALIANGVLALRAVCVSRELARFNGI
jgi:predicted nucleotidyltransferase